MRFPYQIICQFISRCTGTDLPFVECTIWPDLFIVGGGISKKADRWIPMLRNRTPVVAAELLNTAGIVGAAMAAAEAAQQTRS